MALSELSVYSMTKSISAVFSNILDTEQYLLFESLTASSAASFATSPPIRYTSLIRVKTRGGSSACSAVAKTVRLVRGWRFFRKMLTTSADVQLQRAVRMTSIGDGPSAWVAPASNCILWPLSLCPVNSISFVQTVLAIIGNLPSALFDEPSYQHASLCKVAVRLPLPLHACVARV